VSGAVGIAAAQLQNFHADPADRLIVASALSLEAILITADESILEWRSALKTFDARR
jgi:PIN domain nuclease of toxin-antitoxin system